MTYVVTDACIRCKYMDCVEVCPVDWPNITTKGDAPADADDHKGEDGKFDKYFSPEPGAGD